MVFLNLLFFCCLNSSFHALALQVLLLLSVFQWKFLLLVKVNYEALPGATSPFGLHALRIYTTLGKL